MKAHVRVDDTGPEEGLAFVTLDDRDTGEAYEMVVDTATPLYRDLWNIIDTLRRMVEA